MLYNEQSDSKTRASAAADGAEKLAEPERGMGIRLRFRPQRPGPEVPGKRASGPHHPGSLLPRKRPERRGLQGLYPGRVVPAHPGRDGGAAEGAHPSALRRGGLPVHRVCERRQGGGAQGRLHLVRP